MISSATSMDERTIKILQSPNNMTSFSDSISPSHSYFTSPYQTRQKIKNIKYLNTTKPTNLTSTPSSSFFVDLIKQTKLQEGKSQIFCNKDYYFNLLKIQLKKNYSNKLPRINIFSSKNNKESINLNVFNTLSNINILGNRLNNKDKNKYKTFGYKSINIKKKNDLYKRIMDGEPQNLKIVPVNKFLKSKIDLNDNNIKDKIYKHENMSIKTKIENNDYNLNLSKIRFMKFHGVKKKSKINLFNLFENNKNKNNKNKFKGINSLKVKLLFLKNKIKKVNNNIKTVKINVDNKKNEINTLFSNLYKDIQFNMNNQYKKDYYYVY